MSSLRGRLGTSISRDCSRVKTAIAHLLCLVVVSSSLFDSLPRVLSRFDCSFRGRLISFFDCVMLLCY